MASVSTGASVTTGVTVAAGAAVGSAVAAASKVSERASTGVDSAKSAAISTAAVFLQKESFIDFPPYMMGVCSRAANVNELRPLAGANVIGKTYSHTTGKHLFTEIYNRKFLE